MRVLILILCLLVSNNVFADEDACNGVLERAAANISYKFGSSTSTSTQANALCDERYDKMSTSEQQGLDASYKLFSASYASAGSTLKEYRSKYCSSGTSSFFAASQSTDYSRQIYDASIAAWRDCKAMQSANVIISPVRPPDDRSAIFSIAYRGPGTAKLTGVHISPKDSFSCTADGGKSISGPINQQITGDSFSFDCERIVKLGKEPGEFSADASSITVTTSATVRPFMLYFPAVSNSDITTERASLILKTIDELRNRIDLYASKGVVSISGNVSNKDDKAFKVDNVISNTLLGVSPQDSNITIPVSGNYIAASTVNTCISGSIGYVSSSIVLNGKKIASAVNEAKECGSAVATTSVYAQKGDVISGICTINQGVSSSCLFSLALIGRDQ